MATIDIARQRMANQRLTGERFPTAVEVVRHHLAIQAQDYRGGLWAVGVRMRAATETAVEAAIAERSIVRTWPLRGTLHLVAAEDVRWMLPLLTPRIVARAAGRHRQLGLVPSDFRKARKLFEKALQGGKLLTRKEMYGVLESAGISAAGQRGMHILWLLAQEGVLCHGPLQGRQPTFVLLDEWVPPAKPVPREEAIARLARRYFESHGPATVADLAWWAGLGVKEAAAGLDLVKGQLSSVQVDGRTFWGPRAVPASARTMPRAHMLPPFDELLVAYRDRSASAGDAGSISALSLLSPTLVINGRVVGTWTRRVGVGGIRAVPRWLVPVAPAGLKALQAAATRYGRFMGTPARLAEGR